MAETPAKALAGFIAKYTPAMAKEERSPDLDSPAIRALIKAAVRRSDVSFIRGAASRLVIKSISPRHRPRRSGSII